MPSIQSSSYGESRLRMLRVLRHGDRHDPHDVTIGMRIDARVDAPVLPGETIKNLVHRVAGETQYDTIERLGLALCEAILARDASVALARIELTEQPWRRLVAGGKPQGQAFVPGGVERRTATITSNGTRVSVSAGIENLVLLRSAGFLLPRSSSARRSSEDAVAEGLPRLLLGALNATWEYTSREIAFGPYRQGVYSAIVETFVSNAAQSTRQMLYDIADVVLASYQEIASVRLSLQERPYRAVDLLELSVDGDSVFTAHDEPLGIVEIALQR
jgi:urate oxidase